MLKKFFYWKIKMFAFIVFLYVFSICGTIWITAQLVQLFLEEATHEVETTDWRAIERMLASNASYDENSEAYDEEMENLKKRLRGF
jgi:hypothetical protein